MYEKTLISVVRAFNFMSVHPTLAHGDVIMVGASFNFMSVHPTLRHKAAQG